MVLRVSFILYPSADLSQHQYSNAVSLHFFHFSYALFSSFSPQFQKYLESLYAVHSAVAQADGARAAGHTVRREAIESIHPVVRVHPATGWKSVYVNPGWYSFALIDKVLCDLRLPCG